MKASVLVMVTGLLTFHKHTKDPALHLSGSKILPPASGPVYMEVGDPTVGEVTR